MTGDNVAAILADLYRAGIEVALTADGCALEVPAGTLSAAQRAQLRTHKAAIVAHLHAAQASAEQLIALAMRACDHWGDTPAARAHMRRDVLATPLHQRADLYRALRAAYPTHD